VKFGRVEGFVQEIMEADGVRLRLVVTLETSSRIETIRDELIDPPSAIASDELRSIADQYTQETIGNYLATQGWEAVGASDLPELQPDAPARSAAYTVRNLS
jgi:hypothetical protein